MPGVLLGYAYPGQRTDEAAGRGADPGAGERRSERSPGDDRPNAWNGERTDAREQADDSAEHAAARRALRGAFGGLGAGALGERLLLSLVPHRHADLLFREPGRLEGLDAALGGRLIGEQADHRLARNACGAGLGILFPWCHC